MFNVRLSSNFFVSLFAAAALTAAVGCGGTGTSNTDGGTGARDGGGTGGARPDGGGTGGVTPDGGSTGGRIGGTGGTAGAAGAGSGGSGSGGRGGSGGSGTGGVGTGGGGGTQVGTGGGAGSGTGGTTPCTNPCTVGARTCTAGARQICQTVAGCAVFVADPAPCVGHQMCTGAGLCTCQNDAACAPGGTATGGFACMTQGAPGFVTCSIGTADGCATVTATTACTPPMTCNTAGVVTNAASICGGCPGAGVTQNTGCGTANVGDTIASTGENAILQCQRVATCNIWTVLTNCAAQDLTARTNPTTMLPECTCKPPGVPLGSPPGAPDSVYVDPSPPSSSFLPPSFTKTGVLRPAACRFPSINTALAATGVGTTFTKVVVVHEAANEIATLTETGISIPNNITVTSAQEGSVFNTAKYILNIGAGTGPRILLNSATVAGGTGAVLSGFTINGAAADPAAVLIECRSGTPKLAGLVVNGRGGNTQTGIAVRGQDTANCALTTLAGSRIDLNNLAMAINIERLGSAGTASFNGTVVATGIAGTGVNVANVNSQLTLPAASQFAFTSAAAIGVNNAGGVVSLTGTRFNMPGAGSRGIVNSSGTMVTLSNVIIDMFGSAAALNAASRGIVQMQSEAGALPVIAVTGGSIDLGSASAASAIGVDILSGQATLNGVTVTVGMNADGVRATGNAQVAIGTTSVITTRCKATSTACSEPASSGVAGTLPAILGNNGTGIVVPTGNTSASVTVGGTTQVNGYTTGIFSGDGALTINGTTGITANVGNGIVLGGATLGSVVATVTGAHADNNGLNGIRVDTVNPATITANTISGNHAAGVRVDRSQSTDQSGFRLTLGPTNVITMNFEQGIYLFGSGKVGAAINGNSVTNNGLEGVRVSEHSATATVFTETTVTGNTISGNLTREATNVAITTGGFSVTADGDPAAKVQMPSASFLGNRIFANHRNQIGFDIPQDVATGPAPPWDLSSATAAVDQATVCGDAARPNFVYCYANGNVGVAVSNSATIPVKVKGMHFQQLPPIAGTDFSSGIPQPASLVPEPTQGIFSSCAAQACPQ